MQPVFSEYIEFLKEFEPNIKLKENTFWVNRQVIKAFDKETGKELKFFKVNIDDKLNVSITKHPSYIKRLNSKREYELETWQDTVIRFNNQLASQVDYSINVIQEAIKKYENHKILMLTSTGKDSNVVEYLTDLLKIDCLKIFNNTSLDCADTYKRAAKQNYIIQNPKTGFYNLIKRYGVPTRHSRWCCTTLKENSNQVFKNTDNNYLYFFGMRNSESAIRKNYEDYYKGRNWNERWQGLLPIRKWSDFDIWLFTLKNNLWVHPKYKKGYRRVGCHIACPFYTKSTWVLDKYWYPKQYNRWQNVLENEYHKRNLMCVLNCNIEEYKTCWNDGKYRNEPTEEIVTQFANYKNLNINTARKYFNKTCLNCGRKITNHDTIAMNMKLLGRHVEKFACKKCLKKYLTINEKSWKQHILDFKQSGCPLF